jgi:hypothetical protein
MPNGQPENARREMPSFIVRPALPSRPESTRAEDGADTRAGVAGTYNQDVSWVHSQVKADTRGPLHRPIQPGG